MYVCMYVCMYVYMYVYHLKLFVIRYRIRELTEEDKRVKVIVYTYIFEVLFYAYRFLKMSGS